MFLNKNKNKEQCLIKKGIKNGHSSQECGIDIFIAIAFFLLIHNSSQADERITWCCKHNNLKNKCAQEKRVQNYNGSPLKP